MWKLFITKIAKNFVFLFKLAEVLAFYTLLSSVIVIALSLASVARAEEGSRLTPQQLDELANKIGYSNCPTPIKNMYLAPMDGFGSYRFKDGIEVSLNGTIIQGYYLDERGNRVKLVPVNCVYARDFEKIISRTFLGLTGIIGIVFVISMIKGVIVFILSGSFPDLVNVRRDEALKGMYMPVVYLLGLLLSYLFLITIFVDVFGIGTPRQDGRKEYNLFCKNQIIISLAFDRIPECTTTLTGPGPTNTTR